MAARVDERVDVPSLVKFNVGESFTSYKCLQEKIKQYEAERCVQFTHRDSRTLETAKKRVPGRVACANEAPWCVDSPADIHLSDNVLLVLKQKKRKTNFENCNNYDAIQYCIHKNELWVLSSQQTNMARG